MNRCPKCHRPAKFLMNGLCGNCQPKKVPIFRPESVVLVGTSLTSSAKPSTRTCGNEWGVCQLNLRGHVCKLGKLHTDTCRCACGQTKYMVMDILWQYSSNTATRLQRVDALGWDISLKAFWTSNLSCLCARASPGWSGCRHKKEKPSKSYCNLALDQAIST